MTKLDEELTEENRILRQLKREGTTALYAVYGEGGVLYGYEVVRVRHLPAQTLFGRDYPEREAYPSSSKSSNHWGRIAWSWGILQSEQAFKQFEGLVEKYGNNYPGKEE